MNFRLGFGPMSREVIEILCNYSHNNKKPLMIIASRNQVDAESGYVMTTPQIREQLSILPTDYIWMCRDHCGPYFLDAEKNLSLRDAVEATKKTIAYDIEQGFNLIHIDTSRVDDTYGIAEELFKFCLDLNPNIQFEFGTEENVGVAAGAIKYKNDVAFAKNIPNMQFVVAQTGSLCHEDHQAGGFETATVKELVEVANVNGVKMKEHNADYLSAEEIRLRDTVGVHALNIAPQLGVVQTKLLRRLVEAHPDAHGQWTDFAGEVVDSGRWRKWTESNDREHQINVAGHYCFSSSKYQALINVLNQRTDWKAAITSEIEHILDLYTNNLK
jgi:hypothetical protein